jgi:hypothetical protein
MSLRLCRVSFHKKVSIRVNDSGGSRGQGDELILLELGALVISGNEQWHGVMSKSIDVTKVKSAISRLEGQDTKGRLEWFKNNDPGADIVKIEASQMVDRLNGEIKDKIRQNVAVTIESATNVVWN